MIFYRSDSGYKNNKNMTVYDIVQYEENILDNRILYYCIDVEYLKNISADNVAWYTKDINIAQRYGYPEEYNIPNYIIIGEDMDGGYLVVTYNI